MSTRSGKLYKDSKRKRLNTTDGTLNIMNTPTGKEIEKNSNSNMSCSRDLRTRKVTTNQLGSVAKLDKEKATGSNWIVSDESNHVRGSHSNTMDYGMNSDMDSDIETKSELITASLRKLRRRKSSISNGVDTKKKVKNNKAAVKDLEISTIKSVEMNSDEKIFANYCHKDTENDINSANTGSKQLKKKKKKVTNTKKKKQKTKLSFDKDDDIYYDSVENLDISYHSMTRFKAQENVDANFPHVSNDCIQKGQSDIKDDIFEGNKGITSQVQKHDADDDNFNNRNHTGAVNLEFPTYSNNPRKKKFNIQNSSFEMENKIIHTLYDENEQKHIKCISPINRNNSEILHLDVATGSTSSLRSDKFNIPFEKKDKKYEKNEENEWCDSNNAVITRTSKNSKRKSCDGTPNCDKQRLSDIQHASSKKQNQVINITYEKDDYSDLEVSDVHCEQIKSRKLNINDISRISKEGLNISNVSRKQINNRKSNINDITFEKQNINTTYEKDEGVVVTPIEKKKNRKTKIFCDEDNKYIDTCNISTSFDAFVKGARKSSINDATFEKNDTSLISVKKNANEREDILSSSATKQSSDRRRTMSINNSIKLDTTFDKTSESESESKDKTVTLPVPLEQKLNTTFDKDVGGSSKSSLISSDNSVSDLPTISITSDDTEENIENTTPVWVESSMDETNNKEDHKESLFPDTPLKREGTFTKDVLEVQPVSPQTPGNIFHIEEMSKAGCTPFRVTKSSQRESRMNVTWSTEKSISVEAAPRLTRVMFCSPVDNLSTVTQEKRKIIKSNLKGSNKSFVFDENVSVSHPARKRSYTQSEVEGSLPKRSRLTHDQQQSVERLSKSRSRTVSANAKLMNTTPKKPTTPKSKPQAVSSRSRLPNFAALHQKEFDKMESLSEYKERKATRARQMLTPSGAKDMLERISPKNNGESQKSTSKELNKRKDKTETPTKLPTLESLRPGYTRFGFKMNLDFNPFSVPPKTDKLNEKPNRVPMKPLPSLKGATLTKKERPISARREGAKQAVMREKSFIEKRNLNRNENRTVIRGVRTNRRFELQMKFRNIDA